jgi:hypothetical protein
MGKHMNLPVKSKANITDEGKRPMKGRHALFLHQNIPCLEVK